MKKGKNASCLKPRVIVRLKSTIMKPLNSMNLAVLFQNVQKVYKLQTVKSIEKFQTVQQSNSTTVQQYNGTTVQQYNSTTVQ